MKQISFHQFSAFYFRQSVRTTILGIRALLASECLLQKRVHYIKSCFNALQSSICIFQIGTFISTATALHSPFPRRLHPAPRLGFQSLPADRNGSPAYSSGTRSSAIQVFRFDKIEKEPAYTLRPHFTGNKNALDLFAVKPDKSLYVASILIHINLRLRKHCFHQIEIPHPILRRDEGMRLQIGIQPYFSNPFYIGFP